MKEAATDRFHIATHEVILGSICQINQENRFSA